MTSYNACLDECMAAHCLPCSEPLSPRFSRLLQRTRYSRLPSQVTLVLMMLMTVVVVVVVVVSLDGIEKSSCHRRC
jgi:hypothetical protein